MNYMNAVQSKFAPVAHQIFLSISLFARISVKKML